MKNIRLLLLIAVLIALGINCFNKCSTPVVITKTVVVKDTRATELLSEIMGQDCSDITVFETTVTATAYTACKDECDSTPEVTANMTPSRIGLLAVSRDLLFSIPLGSRVIIPKLGVFIVADVMNKRFKHCVDILHANKKAAKLFGKRKVKLIWLK